MTESHALTASQRDQLVRIAERSIADTFATGTYRPLDLSDISDPELLRPAAVFVTLLHGTRLLGCIGTLQANDPLALAVDRLAVQAAFSDPRMGPITTADFEAMTLKISVLSPPTPLAASSYDDVARAVRPRVDGVVLDAPGHGATLLPSVWEQLPDVASFLAALWNKAGLTAGAWPRGTRVQRYATEEFASHGPRRWPYGHTEGGRRSA